MEASSRFHAHGEQMDPTTFSRYERAVGGVGDMAVKIVASSGEQFPVGKAGSGRTATVEKGNLGVLVSGTVGPDGTAPLERRVEAIAAEEEQARAA